MSVFEFQFAIVCVDRIAKDDVIYTVSLSHEDDKGAAGLSYDVSVVFIIDGRLNLSSDAVTANQEPTQVTITRTDVGHVVTVFYDSLNASVFAVNYISVRAELTDRTPAGVGLYSWANMTWDTSPEDSPSPYRGRELTIPVQSFPVHSTRLMNVSCYLGNENSERTDSATIGERVTLVFEVYLRAEGVHDMNVTVKVVERERPAGLSTDLLVAVPREGATLSHDGYVVRLNKCVLRVNGLYVLFSLSSSQLAVLDGSVIVTVFGVDPSSLGEKGVLQVNVSVIINGTDLLYAGDSLRFESVIFYDGMIAQVSKSDCVYSCVA